ncbi:MAG TPA: HNH endonuclease signature motif containing protein [Candidatus Hydrogenedentes bacterium]|nr:HNH endonuclease signature motif containing protein [Candidatus Hydrogenedentota bacterium]
MPFEDQGVRKEVVRFNGRNYRRYPDSPHVHLRRYFTRSGGFLHRDIWEFHHGPIPKGHDIHHKNEDTSDNRIENLECHTRSRHFAEHKRANPEWNRWEGRKQHLAAIRLKAAEWHASEEGRAWHREHAKDSLAAAREAVRKHGFKKKPFTCIWCGTEGTASNRRKKFCGSVCRSQESGYRRGKYRYVHPYYRSSHGLDSGG